MRIAAVMSVCKDPKYFEYSQVSIPCFCENNPDIELHVFTDDMEKLPQVAYDNLAYWNFEEIEIKYEKEYENIDKMIHRHMKELSYWDGKIHEHRYVAHLFVMAQRLLTHATHCLMIDSDTYFRGDLMPELEAWIKPEHDFYQVERTWNIHKILHGPDGPEAGAGFVIWQRDSGFIEAFKKEFKWDDQRTFNYNLKNSLNRCLITNQALHIVYPFWKATRQGRQLQKADLETHNGQRLYPSYIHLGECGVEQKLQQLKQWFPYPDKGE